MHTPPHPGFDEILRFKVRASPPRPLAVGECQTPEGSVCGLCHASRLPYGAEQKAKQAALEEFAERALNGIPLEPLVPSPQARAYRTTTKRKLFRGRHGVRLGLIDPDLSGNLRALPVSHCVIEPPAHELVYRLVGEFLAAPHGAPLRENLRYVILRGGAREQTLILAVTEISASALKSATRLSKTLSAQAPSIVGAFLYEDPTRGTHYLGSTRGRPQPTTRKLFGRSEVFLRILGRPFLFPPFVFSQVNPSLLERMIPLLAELLELDLRGTLYDLYCGYGLFGLSLADRVRALVGVELSALSVAAARRNAERQRVSSARFMGSELTAQRVGSLLRGLTPLDRVLLDPPRQGTGAGVLEAIAARRAQRIVHVICNIDLLPAELRRWTASGYRVARAVPLDMFPGTSTIETVVALQPV